MNISEQQKQEIYDMIKSGRKLAAIKHIRQTFGVTLREAKRLADELDDTVNEYEDEAITRAKKTGKTIGCIGGGCFGGIFALIGLGMIIGAISVTVYNQQLVSNGELIEATVIEDPYMPVFEYEYNGQKYIYESNASSDPPSYQLGEKVEMYINPTNPSDVLVNTFMERWFVTTLLGVMGTIFFAVGAGVGWAMRRASLFKK
ncbi:MAG: DUF3592 domain-containing protein [bacterium]|nr:DUF3592 domain-containing protein [bacterium]